MLPATYSDADATWHRNATNLVSEEELGMKSTLTSLCLLALLAAFFAASNVSAGEGQQTIAELWEEAGRLKRSGHYHSLQVKLDEILAIDPHHAQARKWRRTNEERILDREEDLNDEVEDRLDDLMEAIQGEDKEDLIELWGKRHIDPATRAFFRSLFKRNRSPRPIYYLNSVQVHDKTAYFSAQIVIEARPNGTSHREIVFDETWDGQLTDEHFSCSFP